jgi:hypothetical protein
MDQRIIPPVLGSPFHANIPTHRPAIPSARPNPHQGNFGKRHSSDVGCYKPGRLKSYKRIQAELSNRRLTIVCKRLFGETDRAWERIRFLYQQQGLLQVFEDFRLAAQRKRPSSP